MVFGSLAPYLKSILKLIKIASFGTLKFSGGDSYRETPVPIPNTEVKTITPKILGWRRPGKIGTARFKKFPLIYFEGNFFVYVEYLYVYILL